MAMSEIWVSESLVCLFLALPLFRPFFKALWPLDGLVWLPFIAMIILAGIFPAYGFRPECLPIMLFTLFYNIANLGPLFSSIRSQPSDAFRDRNNLLTIFAFIMLGAAVFTMFAFSSRIGEYPQSKTGPARLLKLPVSNSDKEYYLQIYGPFQAGRPVIFLVPPEIGSSASVELICVELENKGYTVVTYSRKDFDFPYIDEDGKKHFSLLAKMPGYLFAFIRGTRIASANDRGKILEAERRTDIEYLLPRINDLLSETSFGELPPIILAGYGAGGSALVYLNAEGRFISNNNTLGIIAIENRLWSSFQTESSDLPKILSTRKFSFRGFQGIFDRLPHILPRTLKRSESLPPANLPVLYLISGRALMYPSLDYGTGKNPYQAIFDTLRIAPGPSAMAVVIDASPLDYQDFPLTHPVFSFSLAKAKNAAKTVSDTASIIGNYASLLLERSVQVTELDLDIYDTWLPVTVIPPLSPINGSLYVESKIMTWLNFPETGSNPDPQTN
jgi:hypothetical protein